MNKNKIIQSVFAVLGVVSLFVSIPASAQAENYVYNTIPSASSRFDIDLTVCKQTFDWDTFIADIKAGVGSSNPYDPDSCGPNNMVYMTNMIQNNYTRYNQATGSTTAAAKTYFGNDPILGIFNNAGYPAQNLGTGSPAPVQRNTANALSNIFTTQQLNQIYSTGGARTAMPRAFSTGWADANNDGKNDYDYHKTINKFVSKSTNKRVSYGSCVVNAAGGNFAFDTNKCTKVAANINECVTNGRLDRTICEMLDYQAGWCEVVNGQIRVHPKRQGYDTYTLPAERSPSTPNTSCARSGQSTVQDQNLKAFQFIFEIKYPTREQCAQFPGGSNTDAYYNSCIQFYQEEYGKKFSGNADLNAGNKLMFTYTFYGSRDDKYSRWVGWTNPDVALDNRKNSSDAEVKDWSGFSVYEL